VIDRLLIVLGISRAAIVLGGAIGAVGPHITAAARLSQLDIDDDSTLECRVPIGDFLDVDARELEGEVELRRGVLWKLGQRKPSLHAGSEPGRHVSFNEDIAAVGLVLNGADARVVLFGTFVQHRELPVDGAGRDDCYGTRAALRPIVCGKRNRLQL